MYEEKPRIGIVGGGAAGFFAAITCAETNPNLKVVIYERSNQFLGKVKISGGGRCNVTHACFEPREFTRRYPRGESELIGPFSRFQAKHTVEWFQSHGVSLKTERDGRMFPVTDNSETVIHCLMEQARRLGVVLVSNRGVDRVVKKQDEFELEFSNQEVLPCSKLLLATGGCRASSAGAIATSLGHTLVDPVPSLFSFGLALPWMKNLAGIAVDPVCVRVPGTQLREIGPLLITHTGVSGPAILRLSAWGARELHKLNYQFPLVIDWLGGRNANEVDRLIVNARSRFAGKNLTNVALGGLPVRLWEQLMLHRGIPRDVKWGSVGGSIAQQVSELVTRFEVQVNSKSLNKDEFVTCGGVKLSEVHFKTMESKICPGLYFAGELLDIDGITGGFNFQAAWTTGWLAGKAMANSL